MTRETPGRKANAEVSSDPHKSQKPPAIGRPAFRRMIACPECDGRGMLTGADGLAKWCDRCRGNGRISPQDPCPHGFGDDVTCVQCAREQLEELGDGPLSLEELERRRRTQRMVAAWEQSVRDNPPARVVDIDELEPLETPAEHIRNVLAILNSSFGPFSRGALGDDDRDAIVARLTLTLEQLDGPRVVVGLELENYLAQLKRDRPVPRRRGPAPLEIPEPVVIPPMLTDELEREKRDRVLSAVNASSSSSSSSSPRPLRPGCIASVVAIVAGLLFTICEW
jgi:hypothetical protein